MSCVQSRTEAFQILSYVLVKFFQRLFGSCRVCTDSFLSGTRVVIGNTSGCRHGHEVLSETDTSSIFDMCATLCRKYFFVTLVVLIHLNSDEILVLRELGIFRLKQ